jgi:hypothetical protein
MSEQSLTMEFVSTIKINDQDAVIEKPADSISLSDLKKEIEQIYGGVTENSQIVSKKTTVYSYAGAIMEYANNNNGKVPANAQEATEAIKNGTDHKNKSMKYKITDGNPKTDSIQYKLGYECSSANNGDYEKSELSTSAIMRYVSNNKIECITL